MNSYRINNNQNILLGIKINCISQKKAISLIKNWLKTDKQYQITTPNPEQIVLSNKDYRFKKILNKSALAIPDGIGILWAIKLLNPKLDRFERLSGTDLMLKICSLAANNGWRIFFLGGQNETAKNAAYNLRNKIKVSYSTGAKDIKQLSPRENAAIIKKINSFKPHFLFVAYGAPWQEKWIADNLKKLDAKVAIGVGGGLDYLAGKLKRAPEFIRKIGLEWLWRLIKQPWRITRQLALVKFVYLVIKQKLITKIN